MSENENHILKAVRALLFLMLGFFLFICSSCLLVPKWNFPKFKENLTLSINTPLHMKENTCDVLFCGTSHIKFSASPLLMYERAGFTSYNTATNSQPIAAGYYMLEQILKKQDLKVVVLDASSLYFTDKRGPSLGRNQLPGYRYIIDSTPYSPDKNDLILQYINFKYSSNNESLNAKTIFREWFGCVVPFYSYHSRWNELDQTDRTFLSIKNYFLQGFSIFTTVCPVDNTIEDINNEMRQIDENNQYLRTITYDNSIQTAVDEPLPSQSNIDIEKVRSELMSWVQLCRSHNCELMLTKIPIYRLPHDYTSVWTLEKHDTIKQLAKEFDIDFLDLLYDVDLDIDPSRDFCDPGSHMNYSGAQKVSNYLADYLKETYHLKPHKEEEFDQKSVAYDKAARAAKLAVETEFSQYAGLLDEYAKDYAIILTVMGDIRENLSDDDITALQALGLQTDFKGMRKYDSFLAIIEKGNVVYESVSNQKITYREAISNGAKLSAESAGYLSGNKGSILIDDIQYAVGKEGLNIVVYDYESSMVLDSVRFNLSTDLNSDDLSYYHLLPEIKFGNYSQFLMQQ